MSIITHVKTVVITIFTPVMALAQKIEFFAVINVYQKTAGKNIFL